MSRRGALGVGITATAVLLLLGGCKGEGASSPAITGILRVDPEDITPAPDSNLKAHYGSVDEMRFSKDSAQLVTSSSGRIVRRWSIESGKVTQNMFSEPPRPQWVSITTDAESVLSYNYSGIGIWSVDDGRMLSSIAIDKPAVSEPVLADKGNIFAVRDNKLVKNYSTSDGKLISTIEISNAGILLSTLGKKVLSFSNSDEIGIWDVEKGSLSGEFKESLVNPALVAGRTPILFLSGKDAFIVITTDGRAQLRSLTDGALIRSYDHKIDSLVAQIPASDLFIAIGVPATLPDAVEDQGGERPVPPVVTGIYGEIMSISSTEGNVIASRKLELPTAAYGSGTILCAASTDGKSIFTVFGQSREIFWLKLPGLELETIFRSNENLRCLALSPDGKLLASGDETGGIQIWDLEKKEFRTFLFTADDTEEDEKGQVLEVREESGRIITYTLPCGSEIPAGAVCTCNCVSGTRKSSGVSVPGRRRPSAPSGSRTYCTCDKVCTCIPVPSDRDLKKDFEEVDPKEILTKVSELSITKWKYKNDESSLQHIGPVAQEFESMFQVGDGSSIYPVDAQGVALAAIQGISALLAERDIQILRMSSELKIQKRERRILEDRLSAIEELIWEYKESARGRGTRNERFTDTGSA